MPEINLLQNKINDKTHNWNNSNRSAIIVFGLIIVVEIVAGGMFFMLSRNADEARAALEQEKVTIQKQLAEMDDDLVDARGFQAQASNIKLLLSNHVVWTRLVKTLADSTFKGSKYISMSSDTGGKIHLEGQVLDYSNLGKLLLSLETSKDFDSVRLLSTAPSTSEEAGILFSIEVGANSSLFKQE